MIENKLGQCRYVQTLLATAAVLLIGGSVFSTDLSDTLETLTRGQVVCQAIVISTERYLDGERVGIESPRKVEGWICMNPQNGFVAFKNDFRNLSANETTEMSKWLKNNYDPNKKFLSLSRNLDWLEKVYKQRNMDEDFWWEFYRIMACLSYENAEISSVYIKKTTELLRKKLQSEPEGEKRDIVLHLLGNYEGLLGNKENMKHFYEQINRFRKNEDSEIFATTKEICELASNPALGFTKTNPNKGCSCTVAPTSVRKSGALLLILLLLGTAWYQR